MKVLTVIAARSGSKGIKDKNIKLLAGRPLISYTLKQAKRWGKFKKLIVSTDSKKIASIANKNGAEVPFLRPKELAADSMGKIDVLRHALVETEKLYQCSFDCVLDLDVTAPIRTVTDIDNIVNKFRKEKPDCIFSVVKARKNPYFNMVEKYPDGKVKICKEFPNQIKRRQDAPVVYEMNASMYVYARNFLLNKRNHMPYSGKSSLYIMDEISAVDIDSEIDFRYIEFLCKEGLINL